MIEVDTPNYYGQRNWWIDIDDTGTIAKVTICYGFGKNRKDNNVMRTPVNTDDYSDPLSKERMAKLENDTDRHNKRKNSEGTGYHKLTGRSVILIALVIKARHTYNESESEI